MLSISEIKRGLKHPRLAGRYLNRLYHTRLGREYNHEGVDIFEEDWDNLIILDACRYELVEEIADETEGRLESRISRGASTIEFLRGNFKNRSLEDTVYVSANPHIAGYSDELDVNLHCVEKVWGGESWNSVHDTVMPEEVERKTLEVAEDFDDKRLLVHFMQPHYPFIYDGENEIESGISNIWHKVVRGEIDMTEEKAWSGYRQTFKKAWSSVEKLIKELDGKTVVTSDHGNIYNERASPIPIRDWGHPIGIYDDKLVKVPWLVFESDSRRAIKAEKSREGAESDEEEIKEKLGKLGYSS